jgi:hypothetical protein
MKLIDMIESMSAEDIKDRLSVYVEGYASGKVIRDLNLVFGVPNTKAKKGRRDAKPSIKVDLPFGQEISDYYFERMIRNETILEHADSLILISGRMEKPTMDQIILSLPKEISLALREGKTRADNQAKGQIGTLLTIAGYRQVTGKVSSRHQTARFWTPCRETEHWMPKERLEHFSTLMDQIPITINRLKREREKLYSSII